MNGLKLPLSNKPALLLTLEIVDCKRWKTLKTLLLKLSCADSIENIVHKTYAYHPKVQANE